VPNLHLYNISIFLTLLLNEPDIPVTYAFFVFLSDTNRPLYVVFWPLLYGPLSILLLAAVVVVVGAVVVIMAGLVMGVVVPQLKSGLRDRVADHVPETVIHLSAEQRTDVMSMLRA
jgi:hypothetical protein